MPTIAISNRIPHDYDLVESFKVLRTNVLFSGSSVKTIGITSCHENEGKSTVALSLAYSIAQSGKTAVLLDADMGKSVLYQKLTMGAPAPEKEIMGLSHYLSGMAKLSDVLYNTDTSGLSILFAGLLVRNSDALLASDEFAALLQALRQSFDYVIVDTPPLGQLIDCAVIAPKLDRIALVLDVNSNSYREVRQVKKQLDNVGAKILGVILNKVNYRRIGKYYGKYGRRYGKHYGKHYGRYYGKSSDQK